MRKAWIIVGASRGIGLEFVRQLAGSGERVIAAVRSRSSAEQLFAVVAQYKGLITVEECDVASEESIEAFAKRIQAAMQDGLQIGNVILNAGINYYPNRATEISFTSFRAHLTTNTIGPILTAQKLLSLSSSPNPSTAPEKLIFISSDSGSASLFRGHEDGFAAYAASKAALNQMLRHMAEEIRREGGRSVVLAMHPGEVETDMANVPLGWEVEGVIQAKESVQGMLRVIAEKGEEDSGTFWCWDGRSHPW
ncbi:short-chain dehydrogenase [Aspergillus keveii]|uniref:Short-chain dehydrogenase n=1 Tax=Aspergillus keveii TaxID=714993 RepID=A0ABR4G0L3_9EURO